MLARFMISGSSVQGVQLRETIEKVARGSGLKGYAENSSDGKVKVLFVCNKNKKRIKDCFVTVLDICKKTGIMSKKDIALVNFNEKNISHLEFDDTYPDKKTEESLLKTDFYVKREHEMQEMVWALQGAGKVFLSASSKIEELLNYKKLEVVGRLKSVKKELMHIQSNLSTSHDPVCTKQFIADPLFDFTVKEKEEDDLIRQLIEFYHQYVDYNISKSKPDAQKTMIVTMIDELILLIDKTIEEDF